MLYQRIIHKLEELFGIDLRSLALMRIAFGLIVIADLILRSYSLTAHYTDLGVLPREYAFKLISPYYISAHFMSGALGFQILLFLFCGFSALCVLVGYRTTLFTAITWFLMQSMHMRNILINCGGDDLLHILLFWCIFLPWGARWSLDALKKRPVLPFRVSSMATVAFLLQVAFFYIFAGINKTDKDWSVEGIALYYALHMDEIVRPAVHILLQFPLFLKFLTLFIYRLECLGPLFLFIPFLTKYIRLVIIGIFYIFHLGILFSFETGPFQLVCMAALIGFLPSYFWDQIIPQTKEVDSRQVSLTWPSRYLNLFKIPLYLSVWLALLIMYVFFINMEHIKKDQHSIPKQISWVRYSLALDQHWAMFSPVGKEKGWYVMPGKLRDGSVTDIFRGGKPISWDQPYSIVDVYGNSLWNKYYWNFHMAQYSDYRLPYGQYVCRNWNNTHSFNEQLIAYDILLITQRILPNEQQSSPKKVLLWSHYCYSDQVGPVPVFKDQDLP